MTSFAHAHPATLELDADGRTVVAFRDIVGAHTDGATRGEALWEARDCLREAVMASLRETGSVPAPSAPGADDVCVPVPLRAAAKAALIAAASSRDIGPRALARRLGCDAKEAHRLLSPDEPPKADRLDDALAAIGGPMGVFGTIPMADAAMEGA
jgi:antitoxin HicB